MDESEKITPPTYTSSCYFQAIKTTPIRKLKLIQIHTSSTSNPGK